MNENKKGKPNSFSDTFLLIIGYIRRFIFIYRIGKHRGNHKSQWKESSGSSKLFKDLQKSKQIGYHKQEVR
jgi:hypothetical protein